MTPRLGERPPPPVPAGAPRDPESALGPGDPAGGRVGAVGLSRAREELGAGAHLRNDKLPTIGSGDVQKPAVACHRSSVGLPKWVGASTGG
jgi:hypothetical protein